MMWVFLYILSLTSTDLAQTSCHSGWSKFSSP